MTLLARTHLSQTGNEHTVVIDELQFSRRCHKQIAMLEVTVGDTKQ